MFCKSFNVKVSNNLWITYLIVYLTIVQIYIYWISWYHSRYCSRPSSSSWSISFRWTKETLWVHNCTGELGKLVVWTIFTLLFLMKISLAWYICVWKIGASWPDVLVSQDILLENVPSMYELSEAFNALSLRHACILFILEHFDKLSARPGYWSDSFNSIRCWTFILNY